MRKSPDLLVSAGTAYRRIGRPFDGEAFAPTGWHTVALMTGPSGTVTFLFTDIDGSTQLWQADEGSMREALARHDKLLRSVIADHSGVVFSTMGDGLAAAFQAASAAVSCAVDAQRRLDEESW
jgi:class 3 adenylate cyclase